MNDLLTQWHWPDDLRRARWLVLGADEQQLGAAATRRGATVNADETMHEDMGFDVVVCQHLFTGIRHPLLWLESICAKTQAYALLHAVPLAVASERALLGWTEPVGWQANRTALARLARSAGFARVEMLSESAEHVWLKAARQWHDFPAHVVPTLTIRRVINPVTNSRVFPRSGRRAFAAFYVTGLPLDARRWEVRVSIGGYGVQPLRVAPCEEADCMQVNVSLPPGLPLGLADVQLWHRQQCAAPFVMELCERTQW